MENDYVFKFVYLKDILHLEKCILSNIKYVFFYVTNIHIFIHFRICSLFVMYLIISLRISLLHLFSKFSLIVSVAQFLVIISIPLVNSITLYKDTLIHRNSPYASLLKLNGAMSDERSMDGRICRAFSIRSFRRILEFST